MSNAGYENGLGERQAEPQVQALTAEVEMQSPFQLWIPQCP